MREQTKREGGEQVEVQGLEAIGQFARALRPPAMQPVADEDEEENEGNSSQGNAA